VTQFHVTRYVISELHFVCVLWIEWW